MTNRFLSATAVVLALLSGAWAQTPATSPAAEPAGTDEQFQVAAAAAASLVRVEFTLQYDKGECPAEELILQERPWEAEGFVLTPTKVLCDDVMIHPRFVKEVHVRSGDKLVKAKVAAWGKDRAFALLELAEPLQKAKPLVFDPSKKGPYLVVGYSLENAEWTVSAGPLQLVASVTDAGRKFLSAPANALVTDRQGTPVGLLVDRILSAEESWKGSPLDWPVVTAAEMDKALKDVEAKADQALLRVSLSFRSPKKGAGGARGLVSAPDEDGDGEGTERNVIGVLLDKQKVLVLANLSPKTTARLEKIAVHPGKGPAVAAKFDGTLAEYGAMVVSLEKPLPGPATLSPAEPFAYGRALLCSAQVILQGETRVTYFNHSRVGGFHLGWRRQVYPDAAGGADSFHFDAQGRLAIVPVARREKAVARDRYSGGYALQTASAYLKAVLDAVTAQTDLAKHLDPQNVPLTEQEENRLAWMGVELQPLDRELARANGVSELTNDGMTGAIVSYVYEDSPAAKAGIKMGDILLRLHVQEQPKPMEIRADPDRFRGGFPWGRLDEISEQYYDQIPTPWQPVENTFTRTLTDLGFGKKYTADFFRAGAAFSKEFAIVESPQHYESAPRYKHEPTGITVRDITYEARRYFQKDANSPGVVISMLTAGGKGSVAGLKPFEVITQVNDKPVANVKDFEGLVKGQTELRLSVLRMTRGRTVKISVTGATTRETDGPKPPVRPPPPPEE